MSGVDLGREEEELFEHYVENRQGDQQNAQTQFEQDRALLFRLNSEIYVFIIFLVLLCICLALTSIANFDLIYRVVCFQVGIPGDQCMASPDSGRLVASFASYSTFLNGSCVLLSNPFLSSLSDRVGRKKVLLVTLTMMILARAGQWFLTFGLDRPASYWWFLVPEILLGIGGGPLLLISVSVSYVSDLVEIPADRARVMSLVDAAVAVALAVSPTLGSWIIETTGLSTLYKINIAASTIVGLALVAFVKESLSDRHIEHNRKNPQSWQEMIDFVTFRKMRDPIARRNARIFLLCSLFGTEFMIANMSVIIVYLKGAFGWTAIETGYLATGTATTRSIMYMFGFPFLYTFLSKRWTVYSHEADLIDTRLLQTCIFLLTAGFSCFVFSKTPTQFFLAAILEASSALGGPSMKSTLIKTVPQGQFGSFMACYGFLMSLVGVFLPAIMLQLYHWAYDWFPTLPFLFTAIFMCGLFVTTMAVRPRL